MLTVQLLTCNNNVKRNKLYKKYNIHSEKLVVDLWRFLKGILEIMPITVFAGLKQWNNLIPKNPGGSFLTAFEAIFIKTCK